MLKDLQTVILQNLLNKEAFCRKALPHIKTDYFEGPHKNVYELLLEFLVKYNKMPNGTALSIELSKSSKNNTQETLELISELEKEVEPVEESWLLDSTEKWCKDRAVYLAIMESITIIDGKHKEKSEGHIPDLLQKALSVSFDTNVGHDYIGNAEDRFDFYHTKEDKLPFDLQKLNDITKDGVPRKTLNVLMAGCVHPDTKIKIRHTCSIHELDGVVVNISHVEKLLNYGSKLEVSSPDGWVPISDFVDKGIWDEYVLETHDKKIICNENHLFETSMGWMRAKDIWLHQNAIPSWEGYSYLHEDGSYRNGKINKTGAKVPIVDITVDHPNHRYYTDGVSSHNTGVGKSLVMCHLAGAYLSQGRNVLYISMEMAEERIAERIDANLLDIPIDQLKTLPKENFEKKISRISEKTKGKLIIKEYPTASAHVGHFRALLNELKLKKNFIPDVIFVDYLNICASYRMKGLGGSINSYSFVKSIAEELRGLAVEFNVPLWSATQVNREGIDNTDIDLTNTSESMGLTHTCDIFLAMISTENLEKANQLMIKQLKNRYNDVTKDRRFLIGIDRSKMRLYDVANSAQSLSQDSGPSTPSYSEEPKLESRRIGGPPNNKKFSGFKT